MPTEENLLQADLPLQQMKSNYLPIKFLHFNDLTYFSKKYLTIHIHIIYYQSYLI